MKRYQLIRLFFTFILSVSFVNAFAQQSAATELVSLLGHYKTYQANFKQQTYSGGGQQNSFGKLYMQRPGKFRWEVFTPNKQLIIANAGVLWIYDVELQQATQQKIDLQTGNNPAVLLSGDLDGLIKRYFVSKVQINKQTWYQLKPRSSASSFMLVRMYFSKNELSRIWVKNVLGQTSIFEFSNIQINLLLPSSLFYFKPPSGVDVLQ